MIGFRSMGAARRVDGIAGDLDQFIVQDGRSYRRRLQGGGARRKVLVTGGLLPARTPALPVYTQSWVGTTWHWWRGLVGIFSTVTPICIATNGCGYNNGVFSWTATGGGCAREPAGIWSPGLRYGEFHRSRRQLQLRADRRTLRTPPTRAQQATSAGSDDLRQQFAGFGRDDGDDECSGRTWARRGPGASHSPVSLHRAITPQTISRSPARPAQRSFSKRRPAAAPARVNRLGRGYGSRRNGSVVHPAGVFGHSRRRRTKVRG